MKHLASLLALYLEVDGYLEARQKRAATAGNQTGVRQSEEKRRLNDQAYFIICWGQLEAEIDDVCRTAIRKRQAATAWADRRGWDIHNPEDKRLSGLSFEDRAAIVLDKSAGRAGHWAQVQSYYALRNQIAHGAVRPDRIDVAKVAAAFYAIQGALTR